MLRLVNQQLSGLNHSYSINPNIDDSLDWDINLITHELLFGENIDLSLNHLLEFAKNSSRFKNSFKLRPLRERSENWSAQETEALLELLITNQFQQSKLIPGFWSKISWHMRSLGYHRSRYQCKNRWKVLLTNCKKRTLASTLACKVQILVRSKSQCKTAN